jgi:carboxyl-terminal processing protease
VGDKPTFGKGRIQSVFELHDGSALFVTVAKYVTPSGVEIDQKGIKPDMACRVAPPLVGSRDESAFLAGIPSAGNAMEGMLLEQLKTDKCVLKATEILNHRQA